MKNTVQLLIYYLSLSTYTAFTSNNYWTPVIAIFGQAMTERIPLKTKRSKLILCISKVSQLILHSNLKNKSQTLQKQHFKKWLRCQVWKKYYYWLSVLVYSIQASKVAVFSCHILFCAYFVQSFIETAIAHYVLWKIQNGQNWRYNVFFLDSGEKKT